ncbi:MAG: hypothetical protein ACO3JL_13370, partial [Myxococcota bacterium]
MAAKEDDLLPQPKSAAGEVAWDAATLARFVRGEVTLAELEGVDGDSQGKLAQLGYRLLSSGKLIEARSVFEGLVALNPKEAYFLVAAGAVAQREGRNEDAERWYSLALERDSDHLAARANRGEVRVMLSRIAEATEDLVHAVTLDPQAREPNTVRARGLLVEL